MSVIVIFFLLSFFWVAECVPLITPRTSHDSTSRALTRGAAGCRERRQPTPLCACPPLSSSARADTRARAADTACVRLTRHLCLTRTQRLQLDIATPGDAVLSPERCRRRRGCCKPEWPQITRPECALLPQLAALGQRHIRASSAQPATLAGLGLRAELLPPTLAGPGL